MIAPLATIALLATAFASGARAEAVHGAFVHGVASGDPTHDSVVIWTRVTPTGRDRGETDPDPNVAFDVRWRVATTPPTSTAVDPDARPVTEGSRQPMAPDSTVFGWPEPSAEIRVTPILGWHSVGDDMPLETGALKEAGSGGSSAHAPYDTVHTNRYRRGVHLDTGAWTESK